MPSRGTIHVSQPLSNVAVGYKNALHIWNQVMPLVPVDKESDLFYTFGREFLRHHGKIRANGAEAQLITSYTASTTAFTCLEHSYKDIVTDRDADIADPVIDPEVRTTNSLTKTVDLDIEADVADAVQLSTNYSTNTSAPTKKWDSIEPDGTPVEDVDLAISTVAKIVGVKPNTMVIGKLVFDQLKRHPDLLEMYKYTSKGILGVEELAKAFNVEKLLVGEAIYITSKAGQSTVTTDYLWGKNCALIYVPGAAAIDEPAWGYTFMHKLFGGLTAKVKKWREEGRSGDMIEVSRSYVPKVTGQLAGYLYTDVIA